MGIFELSFCGELSGNKELKKQRDSFPIISPYSCVKLEVPN